MEWTPNQVFLAFLMIVTGSINTLGAKWADESRAVGAGEGEEVRIARPFNHPFVQSFGMFFGEFMCYIVFKIMLIYHQNKGTNEESLPFVIKGNRTYNRFMFILPAMLDLLGTSLMYMGLNMTIPSSYQMFRGIVIILTGTLSRYFLKREKKRYEWAGISVIIVGLVIVGVNDFVMKDHPGETTKDIIIGDLFIIGAQIIAAIQMVIEEKFVSESDISALEAVGYEGLFGCLALGFLLLPFYYIPVGTNMFTNPRGSLEDVGDAFTQMGNNWQIIIGLLIVIISVSFFNFAGISLTKEKTATTRTVLDTARTLVVWIVSMTVKWESWSWIKGGGFLVLLAGIFLYNNFRDVGTKAIGPRSESQEIFVTVGPVDYDGIN